MIRKCNPEVSIEGWKHCTPLIVVDATFLKNAYGGTLIIASAQDADRHIFPLAFSVVDSENDASWQYFMEKLKESYGECEDQCIISDRHESITKAMKSVFPNLMHVVYCFHLFQNIKTRFRKGVDDLRDAFYCAAKAYNQTDFDDCMRDLDNIDSRIRPYLTNKVGLEKWTRLYSRNKRYSTLTSNIAESMNSALKEIRELPIGTLLECLRCLVQTSNLVIYTVKELQNSYIVDILNRTCTCERFQYDEMPCSHAMAVISKRYMKCYEYCSYYYTKEAFLATYEGSVLPIGDPKTWDLPDNIKQLQVFPSIYKRPA
ncbi:uncharacterized protein LOC115695008 [Cannabis sativa]|uniref:uncharacterized protein LOC115695008 n=1 Tax=Cannabis sativa TaxID=3483 RepID=UPI0029C9F64A|nr:uncharacterized protein LOC115695008 [Cannabis sativa]